MQSDNTDTDRQNTQAIDVGSHTDPTEKPPKAKGKGTNDTSASNRAKRLPRAVREQQILDAAVRVFSTHGFHAAAMDEISEAAAISKPMIYAYLGSKEELFAACIRREATRLMQAIADEVYLDESPEVQLWCGLRAFFGFVGQHQDSWRVLHRQARSQGGPFGQEIAEMQGRAISLVGTLLIRSVGDSDMRQAAKNDGDGLAAALVGAGESLADWWLDHPEETVDAVASRMMNLAWMGLGNLVEGRFWLPPTNRRHEEAGHP